MKRTLLTACLIAVLSAPLGAAVVTARWGVKGHLQHPGTLRYEVMGDRGTLMRFDLSALPPGAKVYRARLFFFRRGRHGTGFDIVPVRRAGGGKVQALQPAGRPLPLAAPYWRWFDATAAVRAWVKAGERTGLLWIRKAPAVLSIAAQAGSATGLRWASERPGFDRDATFCEIAYEGRPQAPPGQVTDVKAFYRSGQVFITFREIEDYARGKPQATWGDLAGRFVTAHAESVVPRDEKSEVRYRVYMHDKPITPATIGEATLLCDVVPGSGYNTRLAPKGDFSSRRPKAVAKRLAVGSPPGAPEAGDAARAPESVAPGTGLYVHTVRRHGKWHYAVVTAVNGVENTVRISPANAVGPIDQRRAAPQPVLQADVITKVRGGTDHHQWYSFWAVQPLAPRPIRYDVALAFCPEAMARPAPLTVTRGHFTHPGPEMPGPARRRGIVMAHSADGRNYHGVWTGVNEAEFTLKGAETGAWQPFTQRRQEALIRWIRANWDVDEQQITCCTGSWGMWELRRGDLYSYVHGWGMPEISKGFQCWHWANGVWGPYFIYKDRPEDQDPFRLHDYTRYVLENPKKELPYFALHTGWGDHFGEMGWPPFPRFVRALMDSKRAFGMHSNAVGQAAGKGIISFRKDSSLPAFANCSLDDNIGEGDPKSGRAYGQINGYLVWESATIVDQTALYEITVYLWPGGAGPPRDACTVDLTPRRCQRFKPRPGEKFTWAAITAADGRQVQAGHAVADEHGLVTVRGLAVTRGKHRLVISRAK